MDERVAVDLEVEACKIVALMRLASPSMLMAP
jgi:hypothetical protein